MRLCRSCGGFHELDAWPKSCASHFRAARGPRSELPCPAIRADGMPDMLSHADGKLYDSKSSYYASIKAAGCEIVGNDTSAIRDRPTYDVSDADIETSVVQTLKEANVL